jgi:hypothetical protein
MSKLVYILKNVVKELIKFLAAGEHSDELTDCCDWDNKKGDL